MQKAKVTCVLLLALVAIPQQSQATNRALQLIGEAESFFEAPDSPDMDVVLGLVPFTYEAWVQPTNLAGENIVINKEDAFEFGVVNGTFDVAIQPADQGWAWHFSGTEVPVDEWTHLAVTWDFDVIDMYVNGEWVAESPLEGNGVRDTAETLKVGRRVRGDETNSSFEGFVDEVRVSSIIRYDRDGFDLPTSAFVQDEFTLALYHFDEEVNTPHSSRTIIDDSILANHGELIGDAILVEDDFLMSGSVGPDFNNDGLADTSDADTLVASIVAGDNPTDRDINGDGVVSGLDLQLWLQDAATFNGLPAPYLSGDSNLDGTVDATDLNALALSWQGTVPAWSGGDFTADGVVNAGDLNALALNWRESNLAAAAVPEPTALTMFVMACGLLGLLRRPNSHK